MSTGPAMVAGVDSSTQSCKIVICELESGQVVRTARAAHPDGTAVSAEAWLRAFQEATVDPGLLEGVQALAVGGQQHGMVTLDESGELVRDALLWNDNRSAQSVAVGAAKQAAWALSGTMPDWPVPYASEQEPTVEDVAAAQEINARYESVLQTHFLDAGE